jgi:hypothetical protein
MINIPQACAANHRGNDQSADPKSDYFSHDKYPHGQAPSDQQPDLSG